VFDSLLYETLKWPQIASLQNKIPNPLPLYCPKSALRVLADTNTSIALYKSTSKSRLMYGSIQGKIACHSSWSTEHKFSNVPQIASLQNKIPNPLLSRIMACTLLSLSYAHGKSIGKKKNSHFRNMSIHICLIIHFYSGQKQMSAVNGATYQFTIHY
jgi:hypothetical protein